MSTQVKDLSWRLLDSTRGVGAERAVDLLLSVIYLRWLTLQPEPEATLQASDWDRLVLSPTDAACAAELERMVDRAGTPLAPAAFHELGAVARRVVHTIDSAVRSTSATAGEDAAALFEATLEHLDDALGKQAGEASTPPDIARLMAKVTVRSGDLVLDPVCGNGTGLFEAASLYESVRVTGVEINDRVAARTSMRLKVHGLRRRAHVLHGDAFNMHAPEAADVVLAQPPWGMTLAEQQQFAVQDLARRSGLERTAARLKGDIAWLLLAVESMRPGGRAAVLLPQGTTFSRFAQVHEHLLAQDAVEAIVSLPGGLFRNTGIAAALWILRAPTPNREQRGVLMIDASSMAERVKRGYRLTSEAVETIASMVDSYRNHHSVDAEPWIAAVVDKFTIDGTRGLAPRAHLAPQPEVAVEHPTPERSLLTSLELANFKSFGESTSVPLAPLTLVYGANSSGKSSLLQALLLLKQSLGDSHLVTQGHDLNIGGFQSLLHQHRAEDMTLAVSYGSVPSWAHVGGTPDPALMRNVRWKFASDSRGRGTPVQTEMRFGGLGLKFTIDLETPGNLQLLVDDLEPVFDGLARGDLLYPFDEVKYADEDLAAAERRLANRARDAKLALRQLQRQGVGTLDMPARGLLIGEGPVSPQLAEEAQIDMSRSAPYAERTQRLGLGVAAELEQLFESVVWLGPLRSAPQRVYDRAAAKPGSSDGGHVAMYLFDNTTVVQQVNDWLARLEVPYTLDVLPVSAGAASGLVGDLVAIALTDQRSGVRVTPADVGFGISQVLPIVVELLARRESVLAIEQPETHLHPRLQARLADLLIDSAQEAGRGNQVIVETHSEHLMLRVQRRIREGALDPTAVSVVYVDQDERGQAHALQLRLDENGDFLDEWPDGFFDERIDELFGDL